MVLLKIDGLVLRTQASCLFFFFFGKQGYIINYKTLVAAPVLQSLGRQKPITSSAKGCTTTEGGGGGNKNSIQLNRGRTHLS